MFASKFLFRIVTIASILMLAFGSSQPVYAAPDNDNFANATPIDSLPFGVWIDNTDATFELDEPYPECGYANPPETIWFSYTPLETAKVFAELYAYFVPVLAVYTGESLNSLTRIGCSHYYYHTPSNPIVFEALEGVTYYFQVSGLDGSEEGFISFSLDVTPLPQVSIDVGPSEPSIYDDVHFHAGFYDPADIDGNLYEWILWDGTTYDQSDFYYRFTADGDYPVSLTFTTYDGRENSDHRIVQVRTRDVAITRFSLPQTARINQTKEIAVEITNRRYSDNVRVTLFKGLPGGNEQEIGTLLIYVPARANRPTLFRFSYTFTAVDAAIGKVTFRAEATIESGRDALPADNVAIKTVLVNGPKSSP